MLLNGTIQHGTQLFAPGKAKIPTTYYAPDSGVGLALLHLLRRPHIRATSASSASAQERSLPMACPATASASTRSIPLVQPIAQNLFTYLRDSEARVTFADGDARTSLAREAPQNFDVLVVDAFSGDAIPLHLLTTQAIALYSRHLAPRWHPGLPRLQPVPQSRPRDRPTRHRGEHDSQSVESPGNDATGSYRSTWVLAHQQHRPSSPARSIAVVALPDTTTIPGLRAWTDDYSSLLPILRLTHH